MSEACVSLAFSLYEMLRISSKFLRGTVRISVKELSRWEVNLNIPLPWLTAVVGIV